MTTHPNAYRRGDQWFCLRCRRTWDVGDADPPLCIPEKPKAPLLPALGTQRRADLERRTLDTLRRAARELAHPETESLQTDIYALLEEWKAL